MSIKKKTEGEKWLDMQKFDIIFQSSLVRGKCLISRIIREEKKGRGDAKEGQFEEAEELINGTIRRLA